MKVTIPALISGAAILAMSQVAALAQENRISYPSEQNAVLVIEQQGATEARAGSSYEYSLIVRSASNQPLAEVKVHQWLPAGFQVENESPTSSPGDRGAAGQQQATARTAGQGLAGQDEAARQQPAATQGRPAEQRDQRSPQATQQEDVWRQTLARPQGDTSPLRRDQQAQDQPDMQQSVQEQSVQEQSRQEQPDQVEGEWRDRINGDRRQDRTTGARQQPQQQQQQARQQQQQPRQQGQMQPGQNEQQAQGASQMVSRVWEIGMLMPNEERVIRVSGVPTQEGSLESCVFASFERALCTTVEVTRPEIRLTRQWVDVNGEPRERYFLCDPFGIHYTIRNEGTGSTRPATITEELPEGMTTREGSRQVRIDVGELAEGQSETYTVSVMASSPGDYRNRAVAQAGELQSQSNAEAIQLVHAEIDVSITGPAEQFIGREVRYDITVQNLSDTVPAENTRVRMPGINERMRFASNDQTIPAEIDIFNLGTLDPGQSRTFGVIFSSDQSGRLATQVEAMAYCAESAATEISTAFRGLAALQITVIDQVDPVAVNEETVYEIIVLNEGTAEDADIRLSGELPPNLEFVRATGDSEVSVEGNQVQFQSVFNLPPGSRVSWLLTVRGVEPGRGEFSVQLESESGSATAGEPTTVY